MMRRSLSSLLAASVALSVAGCVIERGAPHDSDSAAAGAPAAGSTSVVAAPAARDTALARPASAPDTIDAGGEVDAPASAPATPLATSPAAGATTTDGDGALPVATPAELSALAATLIIPVDGVRASELRDSFGDPRTGHAHEALDIPAPRGTPVRSATDGRLLRIHESVAGGHMIYAADASGRFILLYGHLDHYAPGLVDGMPLRRGQIIGYVGTTGDAPENLPHLHFAILRGDPARWWWRGTAVDPYPLLVRP